MHNQAQTSGTDKSNPTPPHKNNRHNDERQSPQGITISGPTSHPHQGMPRERQSGCKRDQSTTNPPQARAPAGHTTNHPNPKHTPPQDPPPPPPPPPPHTQPNPHPEHALAALIPPAVTASERVSGSRLPAPSRLFGLVDFVRHAQDFDEGVNAGLITFVLHGAHHLPELPVVIGEEGQRFGAPERRPHLAGFVKLASEPTNLGLASGWRVTTVAAVSLHGR